VTLADVPAGYFTETVGQRGLATKEFYRFEDGGFLFHVGQNTTPVTVGSTTMVVLLRAIEAAESPAMTVGIRIKIARTAARMTQEELSTASGISQQMISALENGRRQNTFELVHVARALGVRYEWLATGELPMVSNGPLSGAGPDAIKEAFYSLSPHERELLLADLLRGHADQFQPGNEDQ
jgi:transcriptional regulator with XRE-family HTH domain